jgi:hypothetical protein
MYGGVEVQVLVYLTSAVDGGEWSASCPGKGIPVSFEWVVGRASSDPVKTRISLPLAMNPKPIPRSSNLQSSFSADRRIQTPILIVRKK